jgi:hypothetical protein
MNENDDEDQELSDVEEEDEEVSDYLQTLLLRALDAVDQYYGRDATHKEHHLELVAAFIIAQAIHGRLKDEQ